MACGCKNKAVNAGTNNVAKTTPTQESTPEKNSNGTRIIKREIR